MTFLDGLSDYPTYEELVGTPEEIIQGAESFPTPPLQTLWAQCLDDATICAAGRFRYVNEQVRLDDQTTYTAEVWVDEAHRSSAGLRAPLHKLWCNGCESITFHVALDEKAVRGILIKRGLMTQEDMK